MLSSMSMSSSLQLARECLQAEQAPKAETPAEQLSPFEGIQMFAQTIESSKQYFHFYCFKLRELCGWKSVSVREG